MCSYEKEGWLTIRTAWTPFSPFDIKPGAKFGTEAKVKQFYAEEGKKTGGKVKFSNKYKTFVQDLVAQVRVTSCRERPSLSPQLALQISFCPFFLIRVVLARFC